MARYALITIDIGTTSMRAILYDADSNALATLRRETQPTHYDDGRVEQDPRSWRDATTALLSGCAQAAAAAGLRIAGIALTSQRSSVIPLDAAGDPLGPAIMWQDLRTEPIIRELSPRNAYLYERCGMRVTTVMSAPKMAWMRRHEPDIYARAHKLAGIHDYVLHGLTGRFVTDASLASRTNLLNLRTRTWDDDLIRLFDVDRDKLCDMLEPGGVAGALLPAAARATGLPSGLPIVSAGGDQQCAALGLGLVSNERIVTNTGTGSYLLAHSDSPVFDPEMRVFCNSSAIAGKYVVEAGLPASGVIYRWFAEQVVGGGTSCADTGFGAVNAEAARAEPGCGGLLFLPHFKGSGAPHFNPADRGMYYGFSLGTTRADMARAVLEGIVADLADNMELLESFTAPAKRIHASGGLARFPLFNEIQASMFGKTVRTAPHGEATAIGAWVSGTTALGLQPDYQAALAAEERVSPCDRTEPDRAASETYAGMRARRKRLYEGIHRA